MTSFSSLNLRPGVQFRTNIIDVLPQPLTNHALSYVFVTVPGSAWDSSPENYSELQPLVPTIVTSTADYLSKIGGEIPSPILDYPAYISYKEVEKLFQTSGGAGVVYVIRTPITPQVEITLDSLASGTNTTQFIIKIDGVYYGDTLIEGIVDGEGDTLSYISTTGIDIADNTYDIKAFLEANSFFASNYEIEDNATALQAGIIRIASKVFGSVPDVSVFQVPNTTDEFTNLVSAGTVVPLVNTRELTFTFDTEEQVIAVDGLVFNDSYYAANDTVDFTFYPGIAAIPDAEQFSALISQYLINELGYADSLIDYPGTGSGLNSVDLSQAVVDDGFYVAVTFDSAATYTDFTDGTPVTRDMVADTRFAYYQASKAVGGEINFAPVLLDQTTLTTRSVQSFALNIDNPSNRFVLVSNGADQDEHALDLLPKLIEAVDDSNYDITIKTVLNGIVENTLVGAGLDITVPSVAANGLNSWDYVMSFEIVSNISIPKYIWNGIDSQGNEEDDFYNVIDDTNGLLALYGSARLQDYIYTIQNGVTDVNLLPGFLLCPEAYARYSTLQEATPAADLRTNRLAISSALREVAANRDWFALIDDNPDSLNSQQSTLEFNSLVNTVGSAGGFYGFYYPYLTDFDGVNLPASGHVAGVALSRYVNEGFNQPPAGINYPINGVLAPKFTVNEGQLEVNSNRGMNAILTIPNSGVVVFGARTTATATPVQFVNSRIVANVALQSLKNSFDGFIFNALQTNNQALFNQVTITAVGILQELYDQGALLGATPNDAYLVICDERNNPDLSLSQGVVNLYIEIAPATTLERLVVDVNITSSGQVGATVTSL